MLGLLCCRSFLRVSQLEVQLGKGRSGVRRPSDPGRGYRDHLIRKTRNTGMSTDVKSTCRQGSAMCEARGASGGWGGSLGERSSWLFWRAVGRCGGVSTAGWWLEVPFGVVQLVPRRGCQCADHIGGGAGAGAGVYALLYLSRGPSPVRVSAGGGWGAHAGSWSGLGLGYAATGDHLPEALGNVPSRLLRVVGCFNQSLVWA
jgi:hypothetical protein